MAKNTLMRHRGLTFLRDPEEGGGGGTEGNQGGKEGGKDGGNEGGQQKEFVPITSQEALDQIITDRVRRERNKYADYDTLKTKAGQWDAIEAESRTDAERREATIRQEALQEALSKTVPQVVRAHFIAEAKGVLSDEQVESLLEDLDLLKYANDGGEPLQEKIAKKVKAFAPANGGSGSNGNGRGPGFGQGSGHQQSAGKAGEAGLAEAERRFGKKVSAGS
jgi:hypothetical protein